jgi:aspartyl-tRNA(Asn)/glutamyl-tRNA(Gln) amidotransferase subunit A
LKPTYGRVSRYGLVAFASSLDQIGPLTKDTGDAAMLLQAIAGWDDRDSTSVKEPVPQYGAELDAGVKGLRLGVPKEYLVSGLDAEVRELTRAAIDKLSGLGAIVEEVSLPHTDYAVAAYYIIATAEASSNLARFDGIRYGQRLPGADPIEMYCRTRGRGFGAEVKRRIILGTYVLSSGYYDAYYLKAQQVRSLIRRDFMRAFERVDAIVGPTTPVAAFRLGERVDDPLQMYLTDIFTVPCNLAGICGLSVPCGFTRDPKLPVGLQLLGRPFGESLLLRIARAYEQASGWHLEHPPGLGSG